MGKKDKGMDEIPDFVWELLITAKTFDTEKLEMLACKALEFENMSALPDHLKEEAREIIHIGFYIFQMLNIVREEIDLASETIENLLKKPNIALITRIGRKLKQFWDENPEMQPKLNELEIYDDFLGVKH